MGSEMGAVDRVDVTRRAYPSLSTPSSTIRENAPMSYDEREEILKSMRAAPVVLRALVRDLDDATLRRRPKPGEWAVIEVVAHLADSEERARGRVEAMLGREDPELPAYDQDRLAVEGRYLERGLAAELDRYEESRARHVAILEALDEAGWRRTGRHEEHGRVTVQLYATHSASEDVDHLAQIARMTG
jgi:hypothetical protein